MSEEKIHPAGYECSECHRLDSHEPRCLGFGHAAAVVPLLPVYSEEDVVEFIRRTMTACGHDDAYAAQRAREIYDEHKA